MTGTPPVRPSRDWTRLRDRYEAFWAGVVPPDGRVIAHVQHLNARPDAPPPWMRQPGEAKYLDPPKLLALKRWRAHLLCRLHDHFPRISPDFGPNMFAAFIGAKAVFGADTVWFEPVAPDLDQAERLHFEPDGRLYRTYLAALDYFLEHRRPDEWVTNTDSGGVGDWLAACMGTEPFLIATIQQPDRMRELALRLARECNQALEGAFERLQRQGWWVNWMPVGSVEPYPTIQDDMAVNFSPELYRDVFGPALQEQARFRGRGLLHWHDASAHHVDTLAGLDGIQVIQYGHDPNTGPFRGQIDAMRALQAADKRLLLACVDPPDAAFFLENLDPAKLLLVVETSGQEESRRMSDFLAAWRPTKG